MDIVAALAAAAFFFVVGGWEWGVSAGLVLLTLARRPFSYMSVAGAVGGAAVWLVLSRWSDNRQLYFPFTLWCALQLGGLLGGRVSVGMVQGAGAILLFFSLVRIGQDVTTAVLVKELVVAAIAIVLAAPGEKPGSFRRWVAAVFGSLIAFVGLAV